MEYVEKQSFNTLPSEPRFSLFMNTVHEPGVKRWSSGRIAALLFFLLGIFWSIRLFPYPKASEQHLVYYIQGATVWLLWGIRSLNKYSRVFPLIVWTLSLWHHGLNLALAALGLFVTSGYILLQAPLEIMWSMIVFLLSFTFLLSSEDA